MKTAFSHIFTSIIILVLIILTANSCAEKSIPEVSFYYWKTVFKLSESERETLKDNASTKIYLRYFDLILPKGSIEAIPESPIQFKDSVNNFAIIPVIYIKNEVMLNKSQNLESLAEKMIDFIDQINKSQKIETSEIQIDCDWTLASKGQFMKFIDILKLKTTNTISATIRLHQIKYSKTTGVPKVDYGVLMYYNMGKIEADNSNSIYDREIAKSYIKSLSNYPLPLKVALPLFSWAVQIRADKVIGLNGKISIEDLESNTFEKISENKYRVLKTQYLKGSSYSENDLLKFEVITENDLQDMAADLENELKANPSEIIFYELNEININKYEKSIYKKIITAFK